MIRTQSFAFVQISLLTVPIILDIFCFINLFDYFHYISANEYNHSSLVK